MKKQNRLIRQITLLTLLIICPFIAQAKEPVLRYTEEGKFKIVQLTDIHYIHNNTSSIEAMQRISDIIDKEAPQLIMLTGDIIYGEPAKESMLDVVAAIKDKGIPFGMMYGNHDDEFKLSREELFNLTKPIPNNITSTIKNLSGVTNYILEVKGSQSNAIESLIYCFDSHAYSKLPGIGGYDYIKQDQIDWYRKESSRYTQKNNNKPYLALSFFHIPTPEYKMATLVKRAEVKGNFTEGICSPEMNSGLFTAMREQGDVKGIFVGHDHDNDFTVNWHGILLAYGRYSGGETVYNNLGENGVRVVELTEGSNEYQTWIRTTSGVDQLNTYPTDYIKEKK